MIRTDFILNNAVVMSLRDTIISYSQYPAKFMADDYFVHEPASYDIECLLTDELRNLDADPIMINDTAYTRHLVRIYDDHDALIMTGHMEAGSLELDEAEEKASFTIYDKLVLISEIKDKTLRFRNGQPTADTDYLEDMTSYDIITNPDAESTDSETDPYVHESTPDRKLITVLNKLMQIINNSLPLTFSWQINVGSIGGGQIIPPHEIDDGDTLDYNSFYYIPLTAAFASAQTMANDYYNAKLFCYYGLLPAADRWKIFTEFSNLPPSDVDVYLVICAGFNTFAGLKYHDDTNHDDSDTNTGGNEGGDSSYARAVRWTHVYGLKNGAITYHWSLGNIAIDRHYNGEVASTDLINKFTVVLDSVTKYTVSFYADYDMSNADQYEYKCYYQGMAESNYDASNIPFALKIPYKPDRNERYLDISVESLLKHLLFQADLTIFADPSGILQIIQKRVGSEIDFNPAFVINKRRKMLYYKPYKLDELKQIFTDTAYAQMLIDYYGGTNIITYEVNLDCFDPAGLWAPAIGNTMTLNGTNYIIVEVSTDEDGLISLRLIETRG